MSKALKAAIEANDPAAVQKELKTVKDLNRKMPGAKTPLLYACEHGADKVIEVLLKAGAKGEGSNTFKDDIPFMVAAKHGRIGVMDRLLSLNQPSPKTIEDTLDSAAMEGWGKALQCILERTKPVITGKLFRLALMPKDSALIKLLIQHGGNINSPEEDGIEKGFTALHSSASSGDMKEIQMLLACGADANCRDAIGRTPLMVMAAQFGWTERSESLSVALAAAQTLLKAGADASLRDQFGNDAIAYHQFESSRDQEEPNPKLLALLQKAGAKGIGPTWDLFLALRKSDVGGVQSAIRAGADVNHVCPQPGSVTPLIFRFDSPEILEALLSAGADPNKPSRDYTPLIAAAGDGNLAAIKRLIAAGADIHAIPPDSVDELCPANAYTAAERNQKFEVVDYLKSLGAGRHKPTKPVDIKPGVGSWNDFDELLVNADALTAAKALAKVVGGKVQAGVYGKSLTPGAKAYVVVRPKGMKWSNVFRIAPPPNRFEDYKTVAPFARELANAGGSAVLSILFSDTSFAASVARYEPDGKTTKDDGWDHDSLEEMIEAMGNDAPDWAKKLLAEKDPEEPQSTQRLEALAAREKFAVATLFIHCEPGRKLDVEFPGYAQEAFDGVAFVTT